MSYTIKTYTSQNDNYVEDSVYGANIGVEWADTNNNTFRVIVENHSTFDYSVRKTTTQFVKQLKAAGLSDFYTIGRFQDEISDHSGFRYANPTDQNFSKIFTDTAFQTDGEGNLIPDSSLPWSYKLIDNVCTEAQFFIDNIIKNKYNLNLSIEQFLVSAIVTHEALTV